MPFRIEFKPIEIPLADVVLLRVAQPEDAAAWEKTWKAALASSAADDADWDWIQQIDSGRTLEGRLCIAARSALALEGMMSLSIEHSRYTPGSDLVYVEYVAVAPWNRRELSASPRIRGVGKVLVRAAMTVSFDLGLEGRIGLHSKPASEAFYRDHLRLLDLGREVVEDGEWVYFEATTEVARRIL